MIDYSNNFLLTPVDLEKLHEALYFLHIEELKSICEKFNLDLKGNKVALIHRIFVFLKDGKKINNVEIPSVSKAKKNQEYPFLANALILHGNYKNNYATRDFMKSLIGNHFHFTAYGIDWINKRWKDSNPPTYLEFANYWQKEFENRKKNKVLPKKEWAYINFSQKFKKNNPDANREMLLNAWKKKHEEIKKFIYELLRI